MRSFTRVFAVFCVFAAMLAACGDDGSSADPDASQSDDAMVGDAPMVAGWERLPDVGGGPIQETGVVEFDGKIYVVGGFSDTGQIVADIEVYDIAQNTWSNAAPLPRDVHHANVAAAGGKLYVLGALVTKFSQTPECWVYDPATNAWTDLAPMPANVARGSATVGVIDGKIYLAGGLQSLQAVDLVSAYDPMTDTWDTNLAPMPEALDHLVSGVVDGVFYTIGGRQSGINDLRSRVDAYDPVADAWTSRAPIPTARGGTAAGVVDGQIIVVGGEGNTAITSGVFPQVESYDPVADEWTSLPDMPFPRHGMGAAGYQGTLYVPGGADVQAFGAVATFDAYTPNSNP